MNKIKKMKKTSRRGGVEEYDQRRFPIHPFVVDEEEGDGSSVQHAWRLLTTLFSLGSFVRGESDSFSFSSIITHFDCISWLIFFCSSCCFIIGVESSHFLQGIFLLTYLLLSASSSLSCHSSLGLWQIFLRKRQTPPTEVPSSVAPS